MSDVELVKRWKITETLLERARHALPDAPVQHEQKCAEHLAQYREFLEHNELELALDILEVLGHLISARGGFWRDLERAAENMGLVDRLPALQRAFAEALEPPKSG
jgi:predicted house-cleaning noncanonical NTP pyrophosphatase (MazG superfamily)